MTNETTNKPYGWVWEWADGQVRFVRAETSPGKEFVPLYCGDEIERLRDALSLIRSLSQIFISKNGIEITKISHAALTGLPHDSESVKSQPLPRLP